MGYTDRTVSYFNSQYIHKSSKLTFSNTTLGIVGNWRGTKRVSALWHTTVTTDLWLVVGSITMFWYGTRMSNG